jgi:hypothetical protein
MTRSNINRHRRIHPSMYGGVGGRGREALLPDSLRGNAAWEDGRRVAGPGNTGGLNRRFFRCRHDRVRYNAAGSSPGHGSGPGLGSSGSGSGGGIGTGGASSLRWLATDRNTTLAGSCTGSVSATSQSQQSLHRRQRSHRWLLQESFVHRAQMRVESSPQMLQVNGMVYCFFFPFLLAGAISVPRQRCASWSITCNSCSRSAARLTM